jgi:uncharacterized protein YraI
MKTKNPLVGGLLNVLIPGLASAYLGKWGRAVLQFIGFVIVLAALLFVANLLESTEPPWPAGLAPTVAVLLFYLMMFFGGMNLVRQYNRSTVPASMGTQASGSRTLVAVLVGVIVILCGLLVAVIFLSGMLDSNGEQAAATPLPSQVSEDVPTAVPSQAGEGVASTPVPRRSATPEEISTEEASPEPRAVVTHETLNVRAGPGTSYAKVGTLRQGDEVVVTGRNKAGTWLAITAADGIEGWVYAEYTNVDTSVESLPVAKAPPPPASPTPAGPKPTLSVDEQIAKVAKGQHGTLPQPGEVGSVDAGGETEVTILNDTPYQLTVLIGSPSSRTVTVEACPSCKVYSMVGPIFCQKEGRPTKTIRLVPGTSQVVARVSDPKVVPFYGTWELKANTAYFNCFYIVTSIR